MRVMEIESFRYLSKHQDELESRRSGLSSVSDSLTQAVEGTGAESKDVKSVFATALSDEINRLTANSEISMALSGAMALGRTAGFNDLSGMMESESGRNAIAAMAEQNLNSFIFGTNNLNNDNSIYTSSLYQTGYLSSGQSQLAEVLQNLLERLDNAGA